MKERDIQKAIMDYLEIKKYKVIKFSSVGIWNRKTEHYIPQRQRGVSDLICCSPEGRFVAIEVKMKPNKPTDEQLEFIQSINLRGGIGLIVYSIDEIMENLK